MAPLFWLSLRYTEDMNWLDWFMLQVNSYKYVSSSEFLLGNHGRNSKGYFQAYLFKNMVLKVKLGLLSYEVVQKSFFIKRI